MLLTCACACGPSAEKREARRMIADIERMRDATRQEREQYIVALEQQRAKGAAAERARVRCTEAYRALQDAHGLLDTTKNQLEAPQPGSARPMLQGFNEAMTAVNKAKEKMPDCAAAVAALHRIAR